MVRAVLLSAAVTAVAVGAPRVAVFGFQGVGVDSVTAYVATTVFRGELASTGRYTVISNDEIITALGSDKAVGSVSGIRDVAASLLADKVILGSIGKLGTQTITRVKLVDARNWGVEFEDQMATTGDEDLDIVLRRLAKAVATKQRAAAKVEMGEVTGKEANEAARRKAFMGFGLGLGGFFPFGSMGSTKRLYSGSFLGTYETPDFFAELRGDGAVDLSALEEEDHRLATAFLTTIGVFKLAARSDFTPYFGAGVGMGWYAYVEDTTGYNYLDPVSGKGFAISPGGGFMLFRTFDFHVQVDARYNVIFGEGHVVHGPNVSVLLTYRRTSGHGGCCGRGWGWGW